MLVLKLLFLQVRNFGPLWSTSAMMFESANYLLKRPLTGTTNQLDILVRRYLRKKVLCAKEVLDDPLADFALKLTEKGESSNFHLGNGVHNLPS